LLCEQIALDPISDKEYISRMVVRGIYRVAGPDISDYRDCNAYLVDMGELLLIDTGFGAAVDKTIENIEATGLDPTSLSTILLTHCHIDHIGAARELRKRFGARLVMHELDAAIVERGDNRLTAAFCFNLVFEPLHVDVSLTGDEGKIGVAGKQVNFIHTPGHTPGSISPYLDVEGKRVLFGQDLGAPLLTEFDCDPAAWRRSMEKLLALNADILCDGHSGIYQPARMVAAYIQHFIKQFTQDI
jgi:glyoxylase-like metal-dependent hydrolase (beta-lactamase superfamily II)